MFAGDRLTFESGVMLWFSSGVVTINDLVCDNAVISNCMETLTATLAGSIEISSGSTLQIGSEKGAPVAIDSSLTGEGALIMDTPGQVSLSGTNLYAGGTQLLNGKLRVSSPTALGIGPLSVTNQGVVVIQCRNPDLSQGVILEQSCSFSDDSVLLIEMYPGAEQPRLPFVVPLFNMPAGVDCALSAANLQYPFSKVKLEGISVESAVDGRQCVGASFSLPGSVIIIR